MFERFTDRARGVLVAAGDLAREYKSPAIRRHHILVALLDAANEGSDVVAAVLRDAEVDVADLRTKLVASLKASEEATGTGEDKLPFTAEAKRALELSLREALSLGHNYIGREHLLLSVLRDPSPPLAAAVGETRLTHARAREIVSQESPPSGRRMRRAEQLERRLARRFGQRATPALAAVLRRAYGRSEGRNTTTGDLLVALLETPGTHFAAALAGYQLPPTEAATLFVDKLVKDRVPDGAEDAVKVDATGTVTINDPRIAEAMKNIVGDDVTPEKLEEILRRLQG